MGERHKNAVGKCFGRSRTVVLAAVGEVVEDGSQYLYAVTSWGLRMQRKKELLMMVAVASSRKGCAHT